ncbi:serine/threonine protein kinase [Alkalimarinus coralli]|uniref:serine/threonine protein kinase n=1 Tax=Alkalimarinus coralli TaxID=2935863 RepID=UPI00202B444D|nr:serine/threonine-protein kinase [Alkalimarinus coralli]
MADGRYQYLEVIGEGGMATVYRGVQKSLNRPVAIKVLSADLSDNPSIIKRFKRESLIIAGLNHPNIIHVIDKGTTSSGRPVFVMEYVEGQTLSEVIYQDSLTFNRKMDLLIQVCKGLAYAHKLGVIHRDIKPANILIDDEGNARLLDFGIASFFKDKQSGDENETKLVMGTEAYMAPEQQLGISETSELSDIYSLGVVIYELLSGQPPSNPVQPLTARVPEVTEELNALVMQCLSRHKQDRPSSVEKVKNIILRVMQGQHLGQAQQDRASEGLAAIQKRFGLLDVIRDDRYGAVYLYEEKSSNNLLVIKKKVGQSSGLKEAKILSQLKHPNIANIHGTSNKQHVFIIVMEYISGGTLQDRLIEPMPLASFLPLANQVCDGLAFAHRNRVIHGNLRPSNILLTSNLQPRISDFGLDEHYRIDPEKKNWYQPASEENSELADIYSLGAIFFHTLTGAPPEFKSNQLVHTKVFDALEADLQALLQRMLDIDPMQRPQSVEAVQSELYLLIKEQKTVVKPNLEGGVGKKRYIEGANADSTPLMLKIVSTIAVISIVLNIILLTGADEAIMAMLNAL